MLAEQETIGRERSILQYFSCFGPNLAPDNPEARGFIYVSAARGPVVIYGALFASVAINSFAKSVADCDGRIMNGLLNASSVLSTLGAIESVLNALLSPFMGAVADLTPYRKPALGLAMAVFSVLVLVQGFLFLSENSDKPDPEDTSKFLPIPLAQSNTALVILLITVILQVVAYEMAALLTVTYSPELDKDEEKMTKYVSLGYANLNFMQLFTALSITAVALVAGWNSFQQAFFGAIWVALLTIAYIVPGYRLVGHRRVVHPDFSKKCCGLDHMRETLIEIVTKYPQLFKLLVSWTMASASMTSITVLSTSYLQFHLGYDGVLTSAVLSFALLMSIPGSLITSWAVRRLDLKRVYISILLIYALSFIIGPALFTADSVPVQDPNSTIELTQFGFCNTVDRGDIEETKQDPPGYVFYLVLFFAGIWGLGIGSIYVANTAFYGALIPGGKESTYYGVKVTYAKALTWLPPLSFTLISETRDSLQFAISVFVPFYVAAAIITFFIDVEKGQEDIKDTLHRRRGYAYEEDGEGSSKDGQVKPMEI